MFNYIKVDVNGIVTQHSQCSKESKNPDLILVSDYDASRLGKKYKNGGFTSVSLNPKKALKDVINKIEPTEQDLSDILDFLETKSLITNNQKEAAKK